MKMATTSLHISLSEQLKQDVQVRVEEGRYSNPTDYVRQLIRQDILRKKAKQEFADFIKSGMASPSCGQTHKDMITELKDTITQEA